MNKNKVIIALSMCCLFLNANANKRLIIKYKVTNSQQKLMQSGRLTTKQLRQQNMLPLSSAAILKLKSYSNGVPVKEVAQIGSGAHVIELQKDISSQEEENIIKNIKADSSVEYVEVDEKLKIMNLPEYNSSLQWDMLSGGDNFENMQTSWNNIFPGESQGSGVTVAVIDTGYTPHSNFLSNLVALDDSVIPCSSLSGSSATGTQCYGYTFISDCSISGAPNCSNGAYQADGLDWGDYSGTDDSSWHGSHVSGLIVANGYTSGSTILGGAYGAQVLPVRALGIGGGYFSDVANSILWSVNEYSGITNPNPVQVINMSLGGVYSCPTTLQSAINTAIIDGAIVVAAAGNASGSGSSYTVYDVSQVTPANCANVISVSAKGDESSLSWYSSYGNTTITASGGDTYLGTQAVWSDIWSSTGIYESPDAGGYSSYTDYQGTSQATPHVSSAVADLISYFNQKGILYNQAIIVAILQNSAAHLVESSNLSAITSGQGGSVSGLTLDANSALLYAESHYSGTMLTAAPESWTATSTGSQTFIFTNEGTESMMVESYLLTNTNSAVDVSVSSNSCTGVLNVSDSCSVTLTLASSGVTAAALELTNGDNIVGLAPITATDTGSTDNSSSSGSGGGGCSAIKNGNDFSLLIFLSSLSIIYIFYCYRRRK